MRGIVLNGFLTLVLVVGGWCGLLFPRWATPPPPPARVTLGVNLVQSRLTTPNGRSRERSSTVRNGESFYFQAQPYGLEGTYTCEFRLLHDGIEVARWDERDQLHTNVSQFERVFGRSQKIGARLELLISDEATWNDYKLTCKLSDSTGMSAVAQQGLQIRQPTFARPRR